MKLQFERSAFLALVSVIGSIQFISAESLNGNQDLKQNTTELEKVAENNSSSGGQAINIEPLSKTHTQVKLNQDEEGRSLEQQVVGGRSRAGRMLDLDHFAGEIGKEEKLAREKSLSGQRQSRILTDDQLIQPKQAGARSRGGKKTISKKQSSMSIKGFIPIVSLEQAKSGKHASLDELTGADGHSSQEDEEEEQEEHQQPQVVEGTEDQQRYQQLPYASSSQLKEQVANNFGAQTSIGHASYAPNSVDSHRQMAPLQFGSQAEPMANGRANRKLLGSSGLLSGLGQNRFVSSLIPHHQSSGSQFSNPFLQPPMNQPISIPNANAFANSPEVDCICVPFFQCKNGFLSESQLSKNQLQQISAGPSSFANQPIPLGANQFQVPRSNDDQQQQQVSSLMSQLQQPNQMKQLGLQSNEQQQQMVNDIYDQLRKNIESSNLEQQLQQQQQQQSGFMQLDERSKSGSGNNNSSGPQSESDLQERSLFNQLGRRQSVALGSKCGLMRTCCRIPPHLISAPPTFQPLRPHQAARLTTNTNLMPPVMGTHPFRPPAQPQYQLLHPATQAPPGGELQNLPSDIYQPAAASTSYVPNQQASSSSPFMGGRCGTRQTLGISGRVQNVQPAPGSESQAEFGEFPAHVAILKRISPGDSLFVCSATLISSQWLATAAHCVARKHRADDLKVRLGEWDVNRDDEFYPHMETNIREIIIHPDYQASSLINDIALLRMEHGIEQREMPHITPACLATPDELFSGQRCWLAGWGKDAFGQAGAFQSVLRKVDLPVVGRSECESALRFQTKLGRFFRLHQSAICAGGERGKDACEGDGGAGLYCTDPSSGLTKVAGLVSWGVGCGQRGVPGVYTNLAHFYRWIESVVAASGEEPLYDRSGVGVSEQNFKSLISERSNGAPLNGTNVITTTLEGKSIGNSSEPIEVAPKVGESEEQLESRAG